MDAPEGDELSQLMPNLQQRARLQSSPGNTAALREYIKVLGEKPGNVPAATTQPHKPRTAALQPRAGSGRCPQRRFFTIKLRAEELGAEQRAAAAAAEAATLDPEALKDALLEQARAQRAALLQASARPGTGRVPRRREFAIMLPELQLEEAAAAEAEQLADCQEQLALDHEQWEVEAGVLAEAQQGAASRPATASPTSTAATPGEALLQRGGQPGSSGAQQDSQRAQAKTPGTSLFGRCTPMEGVPERLAMVAAARRTQLPGTALQSYGARPAAGTPAGFTPLEGIPERLRAFQQLPGGPRLLGLPGATRICSNDSEAHSVASPVEGLVQQGAKRSRGSGDAPVPADAGGAFAGFAPPASQERQQQQQEYEDDEDDVGGGFDDGGYGEDDAPGTGGFPLLAGASPALMVNAGMQTGASLGVEEAAGEAARDDFDGYDDAGGDFGGWDDEPPAADAEVPADLPESSAAAQKRARKQVQNPGIRLRNECKRKSLAVDPRMGRQEVRPGVRRSAREKQQPLMWWLNEKKEFGRDHMTMPTVQNVVHKVPNTPWQMVTDIKRRPGKKARWQRAPTPQDLEEAMLAQEEVEPEQPEAEEEEEEEEAQEEQQQPQEEEEEEEEEQPEAEEAEDEEQPRQRRGRQQRAAAPRGRQAAAQQPAASRRQQPARGNAKAAAPLAKAKATRKKAGGSKRRGRR